ncbi:MULTISPECIES: DUF262 domain-containing protein [Enterobacteriaceae]|jgi:hypothetical protein|uniref:DUF262 domain-containing protein n=1 Tax=Enterobacteriaceae TaxID=543 RepID=UPI000808F943|nr:MULTISPECIES: DUF262 domain-containing protein [Enterobacteriaceae]ECU4847065.1 DUF262 domain-containing protein [Salmonella enterica]MDY0425272.1 DUF262 domain-containing protein [Enterobacter sp. 170250]SBZ50694.1 Uncharacterized conserved protein [Klebsiella pneumoniae]
MSDVENQIVELKKTVAYDSKDYTIELLVGKYKNGLDDDENEIYVPDYQRDFVWDDARQSKLIESIVLGLPVPPIFVAENKSGRLEIVDGSQRIRTLNAFIDGTLELTNLDKVTKLNGMHFADFDISRRRKFNNTTISVFVLSEAANEEVKNDLFERINKGSDILRNMETRKGVYRGVFTDFIYNECAKNVKFKNMVHLSKNVEKRQEHEELILRFFALVDHYPKFNTFSRSVSKALDNYMGDKRDSFTEQEKNDKREKFERMVNFVSDNFKYGFSKKQGQDVSRILFEAISVGTHLALEENPSLVLKKKIEVQYFFTDRDFSRAATGQYRTHSTENLNKRIDFVKNRIIELSK